MSFINVYIIFICNAQQIKNEGPGVAVYLLWASGNIKEEENSEIVSRP